MRATKKKAKTAGTVLWSGNDALRPFLVPLKRLKLNPKNQRKHTATAVSSQQQVLKEFGQQTPIVVDKQGVVRKGNKTMMAAKKIGWTHVAAVRTNLEDELALKGYEVSDNRSSELSDWNAEALAVDVQELVGRYDLVEMGLWKPYELEPMLDAEFKKPEEGELPGAGSPKFGSPVKVTEDQRLTIDRAVALVRANEGDHGLTEGRCLELVCAEWLSGSQQ
jgi:hypothetical protein